MRKLFPALVAAMTPFGAHAADGQPDLRFTLGAGIAAKPSYFGSDEISFGPTASFKFGYASLAGLEFGKLEDGEARGVSLRGAFRFLPARSETEFPQLSGLDDIDATVELGLGVAYSTATYEVFANVRYGFMGHESFVATIGSDAILHPSDRVTLRAGPRMDIGSSGFNQTYFGVSPAEASASSFTEYDLGAGIYSVGVELEAEYEINETWSVAGGVGYDRLVGDAGRSPVVTDRDHWSASLVLRRELTFDF